MITTKIPNFFVCSGDISTTPMSPIKLPTSVRSGPRRPKTKNRVKRPIIKVNIPIIKQKDIPPVLYLKAVSAPMIMITPATIFPIAAICVEKICELIFPIPWAITKIPPIKQMIRPIIDNTCPVIFLREVFGSEIGFTTQNIFVIYRM